MPPPFRPQAVGLECPRECEQKILDGACKLQAVPGFSKVKFYDMPGEPGLAVSFHAEGKTPAFNTWQNALSSVLGASLVEPMSKQSIADFFRMYKALLNNHGRCYVLQGGRMVDDRKRPSERVAPPLEVQRVLVTPVISSPAHSSPREHVFRPNEQGALEQVVMRQSRLELSPVAEPEPAPREEPALPAPPPKPAANVFAQGEFDSSIVAFLKESRPFSAPVVVPAQAPGETLRSYLNRYTKSVNGPVQFGAHCIFKLLPRILKDKDKAEGIADALAAPGVGPVLAALRGFFHQGGGKGFWALYPQPDMQAVNYKFPLKDGRVDIRGSECFHVEALRRALLFEKAISDIAKDIYGLLQHSPSLECVSENAQAAMRLMLENGCGRLGDGPKFFQTPPTNDPQIARLKSKDSSQDVVISEVRACLESLRSERKYAFNSVYPLCTALDWILPVLAFLHHHRGLLASLGDEASAAAFQKELTDEWAQRKAVCAVALAPLLKYGANLNRLYMHLRAFCQSFRELENGRVDLSRHPKVVSIDRYGYMTGRDMKRIELGHFDPNAPTGLLPFDAELAKISPIPPDEASRIGREQLAKEDGWIARMLEAYGIPEGGSPALACMLRARKRCAGILESDSCAKRLSQILAPTASMPDAVFNPGAVYL